MSPMMATRNPSSEGRRSRIVSASSSACVGCSCVPSPAFTIGICRCRARKCGAPDAAWRITIAWGRMAASVLSVSTSDSPFETARALRGDRNRVGSQTFRGDLEADPRARGSFEEEIHDHSAAQRIEPPVAFVLNRLKIAGARENGFDLSAIQTLDIEQSGGFSQAASRSTRRTFSMSSISWNFTSMISSSLVCTVRPTYFASMGSSRWPRSMRTSSCTRAGRP